MPIEPAWNDTSASGLDAEPKFQMWRAKTTNLLLDSEELAQKDSHGAPRRLNWSNFQAICTLLSSISKSKDKGLTDQLSQIVNEALDLDKLISTQAAEVIWYFDLKKISGQFNQDWVKPQDGEKQTGDSENVWLVSAPGMIRRGKSSGEDFDSKTIVLKLEIFFEPKATKPKGRCGQ